MVRKARRAAYTAEALDPEPYLQDIFEIRTSVPPAARLPDSGLLEAAGQAANQQCWPVRSARPDLPRRASRRAALRLLQPASVRRDRPGQPLRRPSCPSAGRHHEPLDPCPRSGPGSPQSPGAGRRLSLSLRRFAGPFQARCRLPSRPHLDHPGSAVRRSRSRARPGRGGAQSAGSQRGPRLNRRQPFGNPRGAGGGPAVAGTPVPRRRSDGPPGGRHCCARPHPPQPRPLPPAAAGSSGEGARTCSLRPCRRQPSCPSPWPAGRSTWSGSSRRPPRCQRCSARAWRRMPPCWRRVAGWWCACPCGRRAAACGRLDAAEAEAIGRFLERRFRSLRPTADDLAPASGAAISSSAACSTRRRTRRPSLGEGPAAAQGALDVRWRRVLARRARRSVWRRGSPSPGSCS